MRVSLDMDFLFKPYFLDMNTFFRAYPFGFTDLFISLGYAIAKHFTKYSVLLFFLDMYSLNIHFS